MRSFVIMFLVLFFASCSSISEKDCVDKDCVNQDKIRAVDYLGGRDR